MKTLIFSLLTIFFISSRSEAQPPAADFDINILMNPASISVGGSGHLQISTCNNGNLNIVANSLRITISVGTNAEIIGLVSGSDPRWTILSLTAGTNNTCVLKNTGGTMTSITGASPCADIKLLVSGKLDGAASTITGTIGYIAAANPLLGGAPNASQGNSQTGNDNSTTSLNVYTPVPLKLLSFNGKLNGSAVDLSWITSEETGVSRFDVQRSADGNTFSSIGTLKAGNSSYSFSDYKPLTGRNFYRLQMIDIDGKSTYSPVVLIKMETTVTSAPITIYPNPSSDGMVNVSLTGKSIVNIALTDFSGRTVRIWNEYASSSLRLENLNSGAYILTVICPATSSKSVQKFIVNR